MYRSFYAGMSLTDLPLFALVLFMAVFLAVIVRTWVFRRREEFDALSRLPFDDSPGKQVNP